LPQPLQSKEAEQEVLYGMFSSDEFLISAESELKSSDFFDNVNRAIFEATTKLAAESGSRPSWTSVAAALRDNQDFRSGDGLGRLAKFMDTPIPISMSRRSVKTVKSLSARRQLVRVSEEIRGDAMRGGLEPMDLCEKASTEILSINTGTEPNTHLAKDLVGEAIDVIKAKRNAKTCITGIPSGLTDLDRATTGFQAGDLIILAARPSLGKTALALTMAVNAAYTFKSPSLIFSLEMSKEQLMERMLSMLSRVDFGKIRTGFLDDNEMAAVEHAATTVDNMPLWIDDTPGVSPEYVRAICRRFHRSKGLQFVMLDYLQLMQPLKPGRSRQEEVSNFSRQLKGLAKNLSVPVIALSQLNRKIEERQDQRPLLSDLRESGGIEQDADVIMFIHRERDVEPSAQDAQVAHLIIAKQRNGPLCDIDILFRPSRVTFTNFKAGSL
jgi:replicative DNA helicase